MRIITDRGEKSQSSKEKKTQPKKLTKNTQGRDALEFIVHFQVIWVRINSPSMCQKAKKGTWTQRGWKMGKEKCQRFLLNQRLKIRENYVVLGSGKTVEQAVKRIVCQHQREWETATVIGQDPTIPSKDNWANLHLQWCSERCAPRRGCKYIKFYGFWCCSTWPMRKRKKHSG